MDPSLSHLISWAEPTRGDAPLPLTGPSLTLSPLSAPHAPTVFLFGGKFVQNRRLSAEMWAFDLGSRAWERVDAGEGPAPRYFHTMDVWEDKLVCFGGMSESEPNMSVHDDIWFFDCVNRQWLPQPQPEHGPQDPTLLPSARYAHLSSVSRGKLVVSGGQHADNSWVYEINVYDLRRKQWISKTDQPERQGLHSKGAYRSVACSAKHRVITPRGGDNKSNQTYTIDEEGEGGEIMYYSNYDFAKVRRELDLFTPLDSSSSPPVPSTKHVSPPLFNIRDVSARMHGTTQPPGLRFPTGGIVGNHFILCGLYLASSSAAFSVYALNLDTFVWRHIEPGILATGSWNRAVIWADKAKLLVFGNQDSDLAGDYGRRAVSVDHMAVVSLETFGIYTPPKLEVPAKMQEAGLSMLEENLASDFEVVCDDGRRIKCSRRLLADRWSWFAQQEREMKQKISGVVEDVPVDINDTLLGAFNPARLNATHLDLPEPFPVCVAFVQYFYTLSLSTPLQNRAPVLSALLFLAKQYKIVRLAELVVHALHERLDGSNAVGVYEIATLSGQQNLQVRALNMIHSAKSGQSSRNHRQGPPSNTAGDYGSNMGDSPQVPPSSQGFGSPSDGVAPSPSMAMHGSFTQHTVVQARSESPTLGLDDEEDASAMLAALDIKRSPSRSKRLAPPPPGPPLTRLPLPTPPSSASTFGGSTPDLTQQRLGQHSRRGSFSSSEATSLATPAESLTSSSVRESTLLPRGSYSTLDSSSRGSASSQYGRGLETLPEDGRKVGLGSGLGKVNSMSRKEYQIHYGETGAAPPSAYSSHQAQIISALSTYQMEGRMPVPDHRSPSINGRPQAPVQQIHQKDQPNSYLPYLGKDRLKHLSSTTTESSASSSYSNNSHRKVNSIVLGDTASTVSGVTDYHIHLDSQSSTNNLSRIETGSSGSTGNSSQAIAKKEKKAIAAAEKEAKRAAQQERFEALRFQQAKAMALAKAEAQRKAEMEAAQPPKEKPAPKGRFGKFGAKFTENVLFPSGGGSNSMF